MSLILLIFSFLLGLAIGSFLNVVILRWNTGMGIDGRSQCFSCGKELRWFELVPLFSFIALRGRCSRCKSRISWQYPLVESGTALVFFLITLKFLPFLETSVAVFAGALLYFFIIWSILIVIFVYDLKHTIIPDALVYSLSGIAFLGIFWNVTQFSQEGILINILAGPILGLPFAILWFASRGMWMGLGDAKLALAMGFLLGLAGGGSAVILAFWIGAMISLIALAVQKARLRSQAKQLTMKSEIPFAPFLIVGLALVFFLGVNLFSAQGLSGFF